MLTYRGGLKPTSISYWILIMKYLKLNGFHLRFGGNLFTVRSGNDLIFRQLLGLPTSKLTIARDSVTEDFVIATNTDAVCLYRNGDYRSVSPTLIKNNKSLKPITLQSLVGIGAFEPVVDTKEVNIRVNFPKALLPVSPKVYIRRFRFSKLTKEQRKCVNKHYELFRDNSGIIGHYIDLYFKGALTFEEMVNGSLPKDLLFRYRKQPEADKLTEKEFSLLWRGVRRRLMGYRTPCKYTGLNKETFKEYVIKLLSDTVPNINDININVDSDVVIYKVNGGYTVDRADGRPFFYRFKGLGNYTASYATGMGIPKGYGEETERYAKMIDEWVQSL